MPVVSEVVHPRGLDFKNQRRVVMLRDCKKMSWDDIASEVVNRQGEPTTADCVKLAYKRFNTKAEHSKYRYFKCGRKRWKLTAEMQNFLVQRLLQLRKKIVVTSNTLQKVLASEKGIRVNASAIRKVLKQKGFRWLPRAQKRLYKKEDMAARKAFAQSVLNLGAAELEKRFALSMDGCILTVPPADPVEAKNFCIAGERHS